MNLKAKPIVDGKFWIVEEDGEKVAILHKKENNVCSTCTFEDFRGGRGNFV